MHEQSPIPYLSLDPAIEQHIRNDRATGRKSPYAFKDEEALRRLSKEHDRATAVRPAFVRDVEKILNIPAYNRYADKTQVFSFAEHDEICRRGLHVQLVSRVARTIGSALGLNTDLIEAIALSHDLGHTPFGHAGERFLSKIYFRNTGRYFNHNVHSVRVMDQLYPRNITLQTLDGALCHNGEFAQQTLEQGSTRTFAQLDDLCQRCNEDERTIATLRPSTLEGCVVRVSDMIAYLGKDRSDALAMGVVPDLSGFTTTVLGTTHSQIVNNLTVSIINNSYGCSKISMDQNLFEDVLLAKKQNYQVIYLKEGMVDGTQNAVEQMFEDLYGQLKEHLLAGRQDSPVFAHHIAKLSRQSQSIDPEAYAAGDPDQVVVDYLASMTDRYFYALHTRLFPTRAHAIPVRTFFDDMR